MDCASGGGGSSAVALSSACLSSGVAANIACTGAIPSFAATFGQASLELSKARGRYISTRQQLEQVKRAPAEDGRFNQDLEDTKAEVGAMLENLRVELVSLNEVTLESQELTREVAELDETDVNMRALLDKMNRKLDFFQLTLGNF